MITKNHEKKIIFIFYAQAGVDTFKGWGKSKELVFWCLDRENEVTREKAIMYARVVRSCRSAVVSETKDGEDVAFLLWSGVLWPASPCEAFSSQKSVSMTDLRTPGPRDMHPLLVTIGSGDDQSNRRWKPLLGSRNWRWLAVLLWKLTWMFLRTHVHRSVT